MRDGTFLHRNIGVATTVTMMDPRKYGGSEQITGDRHTLRVLWSVVRGPIPKLVVVKQASGTGGNTASYANGDSVRGPVLKL